MTEGTCHMTAPDAGHPTVKEDFQAPIPLGWPSGLAIKHVHEKDDAISPASAGRPFDPSAKPSPFRAKLMKIVTSGDDISCSDVGKVPMLLDLTRSARLPAQRKALLMVVSTTLSRDHEEVCSRVPS
jgi:hypothetical protein